jgi:hypothetical protein
MIQFLNAEASEQITRHCLAPLAMDDDFENTAKAVDLALSSARATLNKVEFFPERSPPLAALYSHHLTFLEMASLPDE